MIDWIKKIFSAILITEIITGLFLSGRYLIEVTRTNPYEIVPLYSIIVVVMVALIISILLRYINTETNSNPPE